MSGPIGVMPPTRADVMALTKRFASLRAAKRALAPSQIRNFIEAVDRYGRPIREQLAALVRQVEAREAGEVDEGAVAAAAESGREEEARSVNALRRVESEIAELALEVRDSVDSISLAQLRSTLPILARSYPVDVAALLDFLLEDEQRLAAGDPLIDYLVTLLSTERDAGRMGVVRDPATLTPKLAGLCGRVEAERGHAAGDLERAFYAAASPYEDHASLDLVLRETREIKRNLGLDFFLPGVLRAIVSYNAAMSACVDRYVDHNRVAEHASGLDEVIGLADPEPETGGTPADDATERGFEFFSGSVFEAEGLREIAADTRRRMRGQSLGHRASERVVQAFDLDELSERERGWLLASANSGEPAYPNADSAIGTAIVVGLVIGSLPYTTLDLNEIGIDPEHLQDCWVAEVDAAMKQVIARRISGNEYDEACALSETKARFLYVPVAAKVRRDREGRRAPRRAASDPRAPVDLYEAGLASLSSGSGWTRPPAEPVDSGLRSWIDRGAVHAVFAAALLVVALVNFLGTRASSVRFYTDVERSTLSKHLDSAYRDREGRGPLFIGKLNDSWLRLNSEARIRVARQMTEELRSRGVREVMMFDVRNRLQIEAANGELTRPRSGSGSGPG